MQDVSIVWHRFFLITFICIILLSGCHKKTVSESLPDSSPVLHFSDFVTLDPNQGYVLCDLKVNRVFQNIYNDGVSNDMFLVVDCAVEHVFFASLSRYDDSQWIEEDSTVLLWIKITNLDEYTPNLLRVMLEKIDSMIVYGREIEPVILKDSAEFPMFEKEIGKEYLRFIDITEGETIIELPSSIIISDLRMWELFPIMDGSFNAGLIEEIVSQTYDDKMSYDMNYEWEEGSQYFKNGDSKAMVYLALEKYVREYEEVK